MPPLVPSERENMVRILDATTIVPCETSKPHCLIAAVCRVCRHVFYLRPAQQVRLPKHRRGDYPVSRCPGSGIIVHRAADHEPVVSEPAPSAP